RGERAPREFRVRRQCPGSPGARIAASLLRPCKPPVCRTFAPTVQPAHDRGRTERQCCCPQPPAMRQSGSVPRNLRPLCQALAVAYGGLLTLRDQIFAVAVCVLLHTGPYIAIEDAIPKLLLDRTDVVHAADL